MVLQSDTQAPKPAQHFVRIGSPWLTQVDAAKPNSVLLVSAPAATRSAVWGGLMTARAQSLGVQGVVLDGRCRDLSEHRASRFPVRGILSRISNPQVFARGHSVLGQSPFTRPSELEVHLRFATRLCRAALTAHRRLHLSLCTRATCCLQTSTA